jgi:hypothetical protein
VAVVKTADARALSLDGVHWQIQVLAQPPRGIWAGGGHQDQFQYFRFGVWSEAQGLGRVPLNPILDAARMVESAGALIRRVADCQSRLPFPLLPELELWLLDQEGLPLALLATAVGESNLEAIGFPEWNAGGRGERPFRSPKRARKGLPERDASGRFHHAETLERQVHARAGQCLNHQWFRRDRDRAGAGLEQGAPGNSLTRR